MAERSITMRLMLDAKQFESGMQSAANSTEAIGQKSQSSKGKLDMLASGVMKVGALAAAGMAVAVKSYAEFDEAMSNVAANTGASADELSRLRQAAIDAGKDTVYNATESANAINELAKAGMSTTDVLSGGLSGALNLAASDGMEVSEAAELMSSTLAQFNLTGRDAASVADALAAGAGKAQGSAHDLGYALSQSGMVANSFGISMTETVGTLAAFANAGMIGSDAGTSLKTMLIALANPSTKAADLMKELGINAYDAQGNFVGLEGLAGQLKTAMSGLSQEQRNQALATIFGSDAIRAANVLYNEGADGIAQWTQAVSESGYAQEMAAKKTDNLKGDIEQLGGSFDTLLLTLGEGANGPMRTVVQGLEGMIDAFSSLPAPVQQTIVLAAAAAGGLTAFHKTLSPLNTSTSRFGQTLGQLIDPFQRVINAAPAFQSAFTMVAASFVGPERQMQVFGTTVTRTQGVMQGMSAAGQGLMSMLGGPWGIAITVAAAALGSFAQSAAEAKQRADSLQTALESTGDASKQIIENLSNAKIDNSGLIPDNIEQAYYGYKTLGEALDGVGIKMSDAALAAEGNADAMARVKKVTDEMIASGVKQRELAGIILSQINEEAENYDKATAAANNKKNALDEVNKATGDATASTDALADSTSKASSASDILADSFGATADAVNEQGAALSEVIDALNTYYGFALSVSDADISLHDSFDKATQSIQQNGASLDLNTEQGRANQSALNDVAEAAMKAAEAHAKNGEGMESIGPMLDDARNRFIEYAQAMGLSADEAAQLADKYGLNREALQQLIDTTNSTPESKNIDVTTTGIDTAQEMLDQVGLTVQTLPNGEVKISGDNTEALNAISQVAGTPIDPKTGTLTLDKNQYDMALALANGAKIDPKTGYLKADNNEFWQKFSQTQGWKIDPKTGVIKGDNGPFQAAKTQVDNTSIGAKTVQVNANTGGFWGAMNRILSSVFSVNVSVGGKGATGGLFGNGLFLPGYATGGPIVSGMMRGPGTGTSDSIQLRNARVADGEFVTKAAAVRHYGPETMYAMNNMSIPKSLFSDYEAYGQLGSAKRYSPVLQLPGNTGGADAGQIAAAVSDALRGIDWSLYLNGDVLAGELSGPLSRQFTRDKMRGL